MTGTLYGCPVPDRRPADGKPGNLTTTSVIVGGIATIIDTVWALLPDRDRPVAAYQKQVLATCQQVRAVLTKEHPEIVRLDRSQAEPTGRRAAHPQTGLPAVLNSNLKQARASFDLLNRQPMPGNCANKQEAAKRAQDRWRAFHSASNTSRAGK
jgi:hypothetical protein